MASKFTRSQPWSASPNSHNYGLQVHLQIRSITASKCISRLARLQPLSASSNLLYPSVQVYLETRSIRASECISKLTPSRCCETLEVEGRQPIIDSPPHLACHPKGIREKKQSWLKECRKRVSGYNGIPGHDELHKLHGSPNARQEYMRRRAGKDGVCISYHEMMSIHPRIFEIYTSCCWVHFCSLCISVCIYTERLRKYMPYYDVANLVTITKTNMIDEMPCSCWTLRTAGMRIWHQVSCRVCAVVSAALEVSHGPVLRSRLLSKSPAGLRRGLSSSNIWLF